jgi:hypothetical protein
MGSLTLSEEVESDRCGCREYPEVATPCNHRSFGVGFGPAWRTISLQDRLSEGDVRGASELQQLAHGQQRIFNPSAVMSMIRCIDRDPA